MVDYNWFYVSYETVPLFDFVSIKYATVNMALWEM